jgi:hypothetical protein
MSRHTVQGPGTITATFVKFENYNEPSITSLEGDKDVPIVPKNIAGKVKMKQCVRVF